MKLVALLTGPLALGVALNLIHSQPLAWEGLFFGALGSLFAVGVYYWPTIRRYFAKPF